MKNTYTATAIVLHWLMALLIFAILPIGYYMHDLKLSPVKLQLYSYHKWIGISLLLLAVLRIIWRIMHQPPALILPRWQLFASGAVHFSLYLLFIAMPMTGYLMSSAKGVQTVWFGVLPLPNLLEKDKLLGELLGQVHEYLSYMLIFCIALHVAAALKHYFIDRDTVLQRMLPGNIFKGELS
jgi:cytochrome b561